MNRKGISTIVATVLIILITVAAVTIIWAAIIPMINNQLNKGTVCVDIVSQIAISDEGYTCVSSDGKNLSIQIKHGARDFDLADIQVIVSAGGDSYSFSLINSTTTLSPTSITLPGSNEERTYVIDTSSITDTIESVDIAPVVKIGNTQETCDISASKTLRIC